MDKYDFQMRVFSDTQAGSLVSQQRRAEEAVFCWKQPVLQ